MVRLPAPPPTQAPMPLNPPREESRSTARRQSNAAPLPSSQQKRDRNAPPTRAEQSCRTLAPSQAEISRTNSKYDEPRSRRQSNAGNGNVQGSHSDATRREESRAPAGRQSNAGHVEGSRSHASRREETHGPDRRQSNAGHGGIRIEIHRDDHIDSRFDSQRTIRPDRASVNDVPNRGESRCDESRRGETHRGETHRGETHRGETHRGETHRGETHRGETRRGETHRGETRRGESRRGSQANAAPVLQSLRDESNARHRGESHRGETHRGESRRGSQANAAPVLQSLRDESNARHRGESRRGSQANAAPVLQSLRDESNARAESRRASRHPTDSHRSAGNDQQQAMVPYNNGRRDSTARPPTTTQRQIEAAPSKTREYAPPTFKPSQAGALIRQTGQDRPVSAQRQGSSLFPRTSNAVAPANNNNAATLRSAETVRYVVPNTIERIEQIPRDPPQSWSLHNLYDRGLACTPHDMLQRGAVETCTVCKNLGADKCRKDQKEHELWLSRGRDYDHPLQDRDYFKDLQKKRHKKERRDDSDSDSDSGRKGRRRRGSTVIVEVYDVVPIIAPLYRYAPYRPYCYRRGW